MSREEDSELMINLLLASAYLRMETRIDRFTKKAMPSKFGVIPSRFGVQAE